MKRKFWPYTIRGNDYRSHIGSNAGGIKEVIKHGETGYIVDVGDSEQASHYALKLLTDEQLYQNYKVICLKILNNDLVLNLSSINMNITIKMLN